MSIEQHVNTAMTLEAFNRFVDLPENADRSFEYIAARAVEVSSNSYASKLAMWIATRIGVFLMNNDIGHLTGADGGYMVSGERFMPNVAFVSYAKQDKMDTTGYNPLPPDLAIEVISNPKNKQELQDLERKIRGYLSAGTVVWMFDWSKEQAHVHTSGQPAKLYTKADTISGGDILPGFELKLADVYRTPKPQN